MTKAENENWPKQAVDMLQKAVDFCVYLETYWLTPAILSSWTVKARQIASQVTGIPEGMIPTTNNHLEGFNFVFKKRDLRMHQLRGRRLRFDLFVLIEIILYCQTFWIVAMFKDRWP